MEINTFVQESLAQYQEANHREVALQQEKIDQNRQMLINDLKGELCTELGTELLTALNLQYRIESIRNSEYAVAEFVDGDVPFQIEHTRHYQWRINATVYHDGIFKYTYFDKSDIKKLIGELKVNLGAAIALVRQQRTAEQQKSEQDRLARIERDAQIERQREAERIKHEQQAAAEQQKHERLSTIVDSRRRYALDHLWRWPEGYVLTYYHLRWCTGSYYQDAEYQADYDSGYTLTDSLDSAHYIIVYAPYGGKPRTLRLSPEIHKPIWERLTATSVADLPDGLKHDAELRIDGIEKSFSVTVREHLFHEREGRVYSEVLIEDGLPADWIQNWIDAR